MEKPIHETWNLDDDMEGKFLKRLSTPEAEEMGELCLMRDILRGAYNSMRLYFDRYVETKPGTDEFTIRMSLFRDAVVQFAGCFTKKADNIRMNPEEVFGHLRGWEKMADWFHDLRDFYAAHAYGPQRQHDICAIMEYNENRTRCRFVGIGEHFLHYQGPPIADHDQILSFMLVAIEFIGKRIGLARLKLHSDMMKIGPDALYRYPDFVPTVPDPTEIRIRRDRFRTKRGVAPSPPRKDQLAQKPETASDPQPDSDQPRPDSDEEVPVPEPGSNE